MTVDAATGRGAGAPESIRHALAKLQGSLPRIAKSETAKVRSDKGDYSYTYADLADITHAITPLMAGLGLSFTCLPTLLINDEHPELPAKFVLEYTLWHVSGDFLEGLYPLPSGVGPQQMGSAITYARRYCLCAVTGVAPEDDDDAAAAEAGMRQQSRDVQQDRRLQPPPKSQEAKPSRQEQRDGRSVQAQALADLAVKLTDAEGKTVADLEEHVYKVAHSRQVLKMQVADPVSGERCQLSAVISAAKSKMTAATQEAPNAAG